MNKKHTIAAVLSLLGAALLVLVVFGLGPMLMPALIQRSYIDDNIADEKVFSSILQRDLEKYFASRTGKSVHVQSELLRKAPTQSGLSDPKYYLWAHVYENNTLLTEGAVRVAAIDKNHFEVTDFLSAKDITADSTKPSQIFPAMLCPAILKLAQHQD